MMKRIVLSVLLALACLAAGAQSYRIVVAEDVPEAAAELLQGRFSQMLTDAGLTVLEASDTSSCNVLNIAVEVVDRMLTQGSIVQVAMVLNVRAVTGDGRVEALFPVRGVGEDDSDAMLRAVRQVLPRSRQSVSFAQSLKEEE